MSTLLLVDPEQRDLVSAFPPFDPQHGDFAVFRSDLIKGMTALLTPEPVEFEERRAPGRGGDPDVRVLLHRPSQTSGKTPALLSIHGGGMIAGNPDMMAGAHRTLARESGALVVAVDYRLAPETPFPGGLEDVYGALVWLHTNATELGVDPDRISVMGDSGGGCLAAAVALLARDRGMVPVRSQILLYPMLDLRTGSANALLDDSLTGEFVWTRAQNRFAWAAVCGDSNLPEMQRGYLSPASAPDLAGLPPAFIIVGALDLFRDEDIAFAQRLMQAGVAVDLSVYAGAVHGFDNLPGGIGVRARADITEAVRRLI